MSLDAQKAAARKAARARRRMAHGAARGPGTGYLSEVLAGYRGVPLAGYLPIRDEIDPCPAMVAAAVHGPVCVPVIDAEDSPLSFVRWRSDCALTAGPFGTRVPDPRVAMVPEILVVPLLAFSRAGGRLGYGGGYYDRTLEKLRRAGPVTAIGFAYGAQEAADLPLEPTDQPLDMVVTERGVITF